MHDANRDKLIVALDLPDATKARAMIERLGDAVTFYKIGMELAYGGGFALVDELARAGKHIFLDLKLHDIGHTVEKATAQIARLGVRFVTVHAFPQTLAAAARGARGSALQVLGVTVMTSYDDSDLVTAGYRLNVRELVALRARQAKEAGIAGLILSPEELKATRALVGADLLLVTPGVRPAGAALDDQKRVATPSDALKRGANHLVVGRPIISAPDPHAAALAIQKEIAEVCA
ncbi:orotidine-5'-phosphate decarboxylase [Rhodoblastus acidophilus]|uniref:Orotidine 5'-phosphate decarboxylase n=1 Tax=Candidatus Rhodoblastus alkanivorans TaxID=2954117 RepID=A0ABS9Z4D3_9HYPH|nr:orotidine-5'-phosphate decarboxylase [Candidatus Rhodoblastus alkanivorans]MCI4679923.1 orotidine-5'-phosphate decarboxylase [Candidatus Rhodoblastus alkanivorans]MCI4681502.1 orotidine-5'-phosphate decarboxylase [Candidatus Rhodoblastus alkanivorans]MDI4642550.1 orotidine-5'-phosphate decarboxylase [Rhodoblastus acidophilus]